jgi:hypothetical protein
LPLNNNEVTKLKQDLRSERQKSKRLEAENKRLEVDMTILVRGRNNEVNDLNIIESLENKVKLIQALNDSLKTTISGQPTKQTTINGQPTKQTAISGQSTIHIQNNHNVKAKVGKLNQQVTKTPTQPNPRQKNTKHKPLVNNVETDGAKSIETVNSNLGNCLPGEPFIPETVSVESPLDNPCLIVQPASCNRTNNKLDNKGEINEVKSMEHNMNNDKISKAKVSQSYSRRNHNSPPYCEPLSLKSLGNLPLIEISKPFITQKKETFLENASNILNDNTTSTKTVILSMCALAKYQLISLNLLS